jgi:hypothetical protein
MIPGGLRLSRRFWHAESIRKEVREGDPSVPGSRRFKDGRGEWEDASGGGETIPACA